MYDSYRLSYTRSKFCHTAHRLRMSVSYPEAGAYVPTLYRLRVISLRRRRRHEPSSRPPCRPSPGAVETGGHGGGRSKRKGLPPLEKRAAKRGEHSDFHSFNDTILDLLHIFIERWCYGWDKHRIRRRRLTVPLVRCNTCQIWSGISTGRPTPR